ncbi:unnamed protein product [Coffea canephora]|uniref:DH200=94 genomic scaffold, scaffold_2036 n=1 Tax=Coffea canephora TaxID=49390 RepID=A0A068VK05_COFCA|nr:unnamed protein product [Coffea canephora]
MAVALAVGNSVLSAFLQVVFDRMATKEFVSLFQKRKNEEELLQKLKLNLLALGAVLDDAENKQTRNQSVKGWLDELHDTIYQADELLDEINTEALRLEVEAEHRSSASQVSVSTYSKSSSNDFLKKMMPEIEKMVVKLDWFVQQINPLGLQVVEQKIQSCRRLPSTSLVDETTVYGREVDKEKIIEVLLSESVNRVNVTVIPLVGLGGIGKTTLAQLVYNDKWVQDHFSIKAWVCVSEDYDATRITKELLGELDIPFSDMSENLNSLQMKLQLGLTQKKFLLVLDDFWNRDYNDWDKLKVLFKGGLQGSKIIVTTRDEKIALMMCKKESIYHLDLMKEGDSWSLFKKHAFENIDGNQSSELEQIGKKIVKKCGGLPLAVKTVAGLLRSETTAEEWKDILVSEEWSQTDNQDGILPALRLSYNLLPSHLKRCFAFCAVFHKDYQFEKEEIIQLWQAHDLLENPRGNRGIEEIGEEYLREMRLRSLFEQSTANFFIMHDLVNDLARFVSGKYCLRLEDHHLGHGTIGRISNFSYHPSSYDTYQKFELLRETKNLRTFLSLSISKNSNQKYEVSPKFLHGMLPKFKSLRVLSLLGYHIIKLPDSISHLKHLRCLNLSSTNVNTLPEWICTFYNLQTLLLPNCKKLQELPVNLAKLINLSYLDISGTPLKTMPLHMGRLRNLQVLTNFIVGKSSGSMIEELGKFRKLRGGLFISNLENVSCSRDASMANLKGKKHLDKLALKWNGYCGTTFPNWIGNPSLTNLKSLSLSSCEYCLFLPELGQLRSLQSLEIVGMSCISALTEDFYGDTRATMPFTSLKKLGIEKMPELEKWHVPKHEIFSNLEELYIIDCPKLIGELPQQCSALRILEISRCDSLVLPNGQLSIFNGNNIQQFTSKEFERVVPRAQPVSQASEIEHSCASLKVLNYEGCCNLEVESESWQLEDLALVNYDSHKVIQNSGAATSVMTSLQTLTISGSVDLMSFPEGGLPAAPKLTQLHLWNCKKLKFLQQQMDSLFPSLRHLFISCCPNIECLPEGGLPSSLQCLDISTCKKLISRRREWGVAKLPSLTQFRIGGIDDEVESFSEEDWLLPCTLQSLQLWAHKNLTKLSYSGLRHLCSLQTLYIRNCARLQSLPEEGLPASLTTLEIEKCPLLKPRLRLKKGQDWPKVAHIPCIIVDLELVP